MLVDCYFTLFTLLLVGHALADYPLQGDFLARAKAPGGVTGVPWGWAMSAHAAIHGGMVGVITGSVWLGVSEAIAHAAIDFAKCDGRISFSTDQVLHVICKVAWIAALWGGLA